MQDRGKTSPLVPVRENKTCRDWTEPFVTEYLLRNMNTSHHRYNTLEISYLYY